MSEIAQYLLSVISVALIVSLSNTIMEKKSLIGSILRMVTGLVLTLIVVSPWVNLSLSNFQSFQTSAELDASDFVSMGKQTAKDEISSHIKQQIQAYILDKATVLDLKICADVSLTDESPPTIDRISISGEASPYAKQRMLLMLQKDLGVAGECLEWS